MEPEYSDLVNCVCGKDRKDTDRLKALLTNAVLATDVFDKVLKQERDKKWDRVFGIVDLTSDEAERLDSLKATIVMEHLIQASDVAHTMQHWHVYIRWVSWCFPRDLDDTIVAMTGAYQNIFHIALVP
jgi:hypothetical protein